MPNNTRDTHSSAGEDLASILGHQSDLGSSDRRVLGFDDDDIVAGSDG